MTENYTLLKNELLVMGSIIQNLGTVLEHYATNMSVCDVINELTRMSVEHCLVFAEIVVPLCLVPVDGDVFAANL